LIPGKATDKKLLHFNDDGTFKDQAKREEPFASYGFPYLPDVSCVGGIESISTVADATSLLIVAKRTSGLCPPLVLKLDLKTKEFWELNVNSKDFWVLH
jgi:hypothetical protein